MAAGAAKFAGPIGLAITAAQAGYGAYTGWTETKGPWQEKAKGAAGGAVEQLSMGLINKQQVMDGINWLYSQTKDIPSKIMGFLGGLKNTVTKPLFDAWNNAKKTVSNAIGGIIGFVRSLPGRVLGSLVSFGNNVKQKIKDAWNNAQKFVNDAIGNIISVLSSLPGRAWGSLVSFGESTSKQTIKDAWNSAKSIVTGRINDVMSAITGLPGRAASALSDFVGVVKGKMLDALGPAKQFVCSIIGCSPGILPALRQLAAETPYYVGSVIPHMEKLNNTLNAPFTSRYVDMLSGLPVDDVYGSVGLDLKSNISVLDMDGGIPHPPNISKYTVHETGHHVHHHAPITVDARDMTRGEFKSLLIDILEGAKK